VIKPRDLRRSLAAAALLVCLCSTPAHAYIGPGAGFALGGSLLAVFAAVGSALLTILFWPVRWLLRAVFGTRARGDYKRVVILGLDGMDHGLTTQMLEEGKLPNLARLRGQGCFKPLASTVPPISPVAWSAFQTGANPGKHNIFDFLIPDLRTYQAKLSSVDIRPPKRYLKFGRYQFPLGKASVRLLRKSQPFWNLLGKHGVFCSVLRVPITFPPEKLRGVLLSAMCVPDLRGTQGLFSYYTTRPADDNEKIGGEVHRVHRAGDLINARLIGPPHPFRSDGRPLEIPFQVRILDAATAQLTIAGERHALHKDRYTEWLTVRFPMLPGMKVNGICKFLLIATEPEFKLYVTPINIDPEKPAMAVGHPSVFSVYLSKQQGAYATLGLAEDTWSLNEGLITDDHFIAQCVDADDERERMFFDALEKVPRGLVCVVFDGTDRLQHAFFRDIDERHPARPDAAVLARRDVIGDLYKRMDDLVGKTMAQCERDENLLFVISDHGFNSFRRGVDLNRWLLDNGYLVLHDGRGREEHLAGVDWSRSRAFAIGLAGIYVNQKDKYDQGIVAPGKELDALRAEIAAKLTGLVDPDRNEQAVKRVYITNQFYKGPYKDDGPDLVIGYDRGYRVSWETAIGKTTEAVFHDNNKAWSGDHCVDPSLVPGILFCNQPIEAAHPRLLDIGPTVLGVFGVPVPDYMDGKALPVGKAARAVSAKPADRVLSEA
jgi:predicted AlkP superfamily phosphohydrolase/phosphomutase